MLKGSDSEKFRLASGQLAFRPLVQRLALQEFLLALERKTPEALTALEHLGVTPTAEFDELDYQSWLKQFGLGGVSGYGPDGLRSAVHITINSWLKLRGVRIDLPAPRRSREVTR